MIHLWRGALTCLLSLSVLASMAAAELIAPDPISSASTGYEVRPAGSGPGLDGILAGEDPAKVWVHFTDKEIFDERTYLARLDAVRDALDPHAADRRSKVLGPGKVDFLDVPVSETYVDRLRERGVDVLRHSRWLNAVSARVPLALLPEVATLPFVHAITPVGRSARDRRILDPGDAPAPSSNRAGLPLDYGASFNQLDEIGVIEAHAAGYSGAGVIVAMFDTGFKWDHPAFQTIIDEGRLLAQWDFVNDDPETMDEPGDVPGHQDHGSATWSALAGFTEGTLIGPAYGATFLLAKTEDATSETPVEEDNWVAAAEWADALGADVISSSLAYLDWYSPEDMDGNTAVITIAADIAVGRGIVVCTAAGNMGDQDWRIVTAPADGDSVIAVGAVDSLNVVAGFSSRGPTADGRTKPEVVARGIGVVCACNFSHDPLVDEFATDSGTSLAAPLVAGGAALLLEAFPSWTPMMVRDALMSTADNAATPDNDRGWGRIDVAAALAGAVHTPAVGGRPVGLQVNAAPNPLHGETLLTLSGMADQSLGGRIEIFDVTGRRVAVRDVDPGTTTATWNGRDLVGRPVAPGVYQVRVRVGDRVGSTKLVVER